MISDDLAYILYISIYINPLQVYPAAADSRVSLRSTTTFSDGSLALCRDINQLGTRIYPTQSFILSELNSWESAYAILRSFQLKSAYCEADDVMCFQ